jgi:NADH:ubiquinone oxidoreductase subunit K
MKTFFKSNFFWTKVLPTAFFCVFAAGTIYPFSTLTLATGIFCIVLITILLLNLFFKKWWISYIIGVVVFLISFYFVLAVLSDYKKFPDKSSFEALTLLIVGCGLFLSAMVMGIMLCFPFKRKNTDINVLLS